MPTINGYKRLVGGEAFWAPNAVTYGYDSRAASVRSFSDPQETSQRSHRPRAEDEYEILCNETLLPLGMSLAAIRQYVWKQGTELVLYYRRKAPIPEVASHPHAAVANVR